MTAKLQMNRLGLRSNRFKIKTSGNLRIHLEEFTEYSTMLYYENQQFVNLETTLGSQLIMPQNLPGH